MVNDDQHEKFKTSIAGFYKSNEKSNANMLKFADGGQGFMKEIEDSPERTSMEPQLSDMQYHQHSDNFDIIQIIMRKFNAKKKDGGDQGAPKMKRP